MNELKTYFTIEDKEFDVLIEFDYQLGTKEEIDAPATCSQVGIQEIHLHISDKKSIAMLTPTFDWMLSNEVMERFEMECLIEIEGKK